jgi:hypothetical protein
MKTNVTTEPERRANAAILEAAAKALLPARLADRHSTPAFVEEADDVIKRFSTHKPQPTKSGKKLQLRLGVELQRRALPALNMLYDVPQPPHFILSNEVRF